MWAPRPRAAFGARTVECLARPRVQQRVLRHRPAAFFSGAAQTRVEARELKSAAKKESSDGPIEKDSEYDEAIAHAKEKQARTPWHRQGSNLPPVSRPRVASAMTKGMICLLYSLTFAESLGKLLTTPSRLLKLIIPLTTLDKNNDRKDVEPLALLVHPQQPLSYLERLIQSELPNIRSSKGEEKIPAVHFKAQDSTQDEIQPKTKTDSEVAEDREGETDADRTAGEDSLGGGKIAGTGILNRKSRSEAAQLRGGHGEGGVESYSGHGHEGEAPPPEKENFVRWSSSTEIGDFIRDAARGKEFAVEIEGAEKEIRIGVPSFNDRTHYLRERLRRTATKIKGMAELKKECDDAAHRGAQRVALSGFGGVLGWWFAVYYLTFQTDLGWDFMEPVTVSVSFHPGYADHALTWTSTWWA